MLEFAQVAIEMPVVYGGLVLTAGLYIWAMFFFFQMAAGDNAKRIRLVVALTLSALGIGFAMIYGGRPAIWQQVVCIIMMLVSHLVFWSAYRSHFSKPSAAYADDAPVAIVTHGPYSMVRHPFYLAYLLAFAAGAIVTNHWYAWLGPALLTLTYYHIALSEEKLILQSENRDLYHQYQQTTGALLPRLFSRAGQS